MVYSTPVYFFHLIILQHKKNFLPGVKKSNFSPSNFSYQIQQIAAQLGNRGLLETSEENLEKLHKIGRRTREKKSRLSGPRENLSDMLIK